MIEISQKTYDRNEVKKETLEYFNGDELAAEVWINKYCLKDSDGNLYEKSPEDMHQRLARELARIEAKYPNPLSEGEIFETFDHFKRIVPQGGSMTGIGNDMQIVSLSNCFVVGNKGKTDSYGGILKTDQDQVQLMKRRGGVGHDLSHIRPSGSPVKNSALTSTGIVPFMERYSNSTIEVAQDGRRGALMLSVSIKHPDAEDFIDAKMKQGKVTGANVSVKIDNEFMGAVKDDKDYIQTYPVDLDITKHTAFMEELFNDNVEYNKIYNLQYEGGVEYKGCYAKKINAKNLWEKIVHNAWKSAEPGILFWDNVIDEAIPDNYGEEWKTVSTNPCGEIPLCPHDSCRLLAVNLYGYVVNPFTTEAYFDQELFEKDVQIAQRYMDDIIDLEVEKIDKILKKIESDPEDEFIKLYEINLWEKIKEMTLKGRRTGLGVTGEGDMLAALGLTYGTDDANKFSETIHKALKLNAYRSSVTMAKERGAFPVYDFYKESDNPFLLRIKDEDPQLYDDMIQYGRRNISLLTVAPTGCSDKESIVTSKNGFYKLSELCDLNKDGFHDLSREIDVIQDTTFNKATKAFNNGIAKTKRITTSSGIELESTLNHQYKIISEDGKYHWKRVDELMLGDMIVSRIGGYKKNSNPKLKLIDEKINENHWEFKESPIRQPNEINDDFAKFLGIFYGDGSVHESGIRIHCNYNSDQVKIVKKLAKKIFNLDVKSCGERTCESVYISSKMLLRFLKINNLLKQRSYEIEIPLLIRMSSKKSIESFIEGYWIADGSKTNNTKYIDTTSKKMAQQLAIIMRGLGKNSRIQTYTERNKSMGNKPIYRIYEKGFGSVKFTKERYVRNDYKEWLNKVRKFGDELFFDEVIDIIDSETETMDIEVPNKNMYVLNSSISHNTVSLMTQTTSGIEPVFLPVYKRRRKINPNDKDVRIDFVDETGIAWMEYPVFHHNFKTWLKTNGYDVDVVKSMTMDQVEEIVRQSPYYRATSNDVDWVKKVEMQGKIQKHVDHSISVTVNLPKNVTEETVAAVYEKGWSSGCKGITVYRDGSRSGVLITDEDKKKKEKEKLFDDHHAPKRPKRVKGEIHRFQNNLEKWIAVVGIVDGRPYEIFTGRLQNGLSNLPMSLIECEVVKKIIEKEDNTRGKRYDIEYIDSNGEKVILKGLSHTFNPEFWNYAKMISSVLRHGMPIVHVVDLVNSLNLEGDHLNTWKNGVSRVLKKYIKDGEKGKGKCPVCGSEHLEYKEGCLTCMGCGSSKCG